jgi:urea transport system ATP-binding protein
MLETRDLTLHYGGSQILNGVSMRAERGRSDLRDGHQRRRQDLADEGHFGQPRALGRHAQLDGQDLPVLPAHRLAQMGIGYVPQGRMIFPLLTVRENLETGFACLPKASGPFPPASSSCSLS